MSAKERATDLRVAAQKIDATIDRIFAALRHGADNAEQLWSKCAGADGRISIDELAQMRTSIQALLAAHPYFDGAGLVVDPGALQDTTRYQEWWRPAAHGEFEFLDVNTGFGEEPYDYTSMSWFAGAAKGHDSVRGPYVDLSGSDLYVLTFAVPAHHGVQFIGISGADITVANFENLVLGEISSLNSEVVVVNGADRVVISSSADYSPGDRMRAAAASDARIGGPGVNWRVHSV
jgi:hypothetical protein